MAGSVNGEFQDLYISLVMRFSHHRTGLYITLVWIDEVAVNV